MFSDSTQELLEKIWEVIITLWHFELFKSGDSTIYLNQVIVALIVVFVGFIVSKWISRSIGRRLARMGKLNQNTTYALQRLFHLVFVVVIVLVALPIAGIPITIFTVLGGAVAIGVGFGMQNLFNNLISGLILMIEKPIRIGDIVFIGGDEGRVEDIGNRCVRVRRGNGVDVLIVQKLMRHANLNTTKIYDMRGEDEKIKAIESLPF